jgi:hypothetical protein
LQVNHSIGQQHLKKKQERVLFHRSKITSWQKNNQNKKLQTKSIFTFLANNMFGHANNTGASKKKLKTSNYVMFFSALSTLVVVFLSCENKCSFFIYCFWSAASVSSQYREAF